MAEDACRFCGRSAAKTSRGYPLCRYHLLAYEGLEAGYKIWKERFEELAWRNYLRRLSELPNTGAWVRDIASAELQKLEA